MMYKVELQGCLKRLSKTERIYIDSQFLHSRVEGNG